jgi:hypothetical protein
MVVGRPLFDMTNGWEVTPPSGEHVVVVSHRAAPDGWHPEASYHFVDDVAAAIAKAKEPLDLLLARPRLDRAGGDGLQHHGRNHHHAQHTPDHPEAVTVAGEQPASDRPATPPTQGLTVPHRRGVSPFAAGRARQ